MAQERIAAWATAALSPLSDAPDGALTYRVPALPAAPPLFGSLYFDAAEAAKEARRSGVWAQPRLAEQLWPPAPAPIRPLMPLRKGHLALLIAAGMLDNVILRDGDRRLLIKGRTRKEFVPVDGGDEDTLVEREALRTSVVTLDLATGAIERIEQGAARVGTGGAT